MVELVESGLADQEHEFDPEDAIVDGFQEHIKLLPHQIIGRKWMREREEGKKFGGILADDMGLGKTIQTLTRIVEGRPSREDREDWSRCTLVVCPVSLIGQWASEIKKMAVGLHVLEHTGASRARDPAKLRTYDVVITSYQTLTSEHGNSVGDARDESKSKSKFNSSKPSQGDSSDSDTVFGRALVNKKTTTATGRAKKAPQDALFKVKWWRIVLDEGHNIKNHKAKSSIACCELQAKFRWILTGTPLQNNVEELYAFFKFLRIRPLNDWGTFNETINKPVRTGRSARAMKRLQIVLQAIMLRRTKESTMNGKKLLELPARVVDLVECEFDDAERVFYKSLEDKTAKIFEDLAKNDAVMKNLTSVLVMLLRLRQACDHPSLVSKDYRKDADALDASSSQKEGKDDADALADMFGGLSVAKAKCTICQIELEPDHKSPNCSDCALTLAIEARRKSVGRPGASLNLDLPPESAKIRKMLELLQKIDEESDGEDKTIIFSQFTTMMDLMEPFLKDAGIKFVRYDGSMNSDQRKAAIERIQTSKSTKVILISFKAGGTGLNLTCCNRVILVDMWWNPALEDQAFDRAHRFGQKKDVLIYKLMVEETIEQRILHLQETKRALAAAALGGQKLGNNKLGLQDLMALFRPGAMQSDDEDDD
ncbi:hypothetical protein AURDEDRAFT_98801 [Auricularia subglabra TFB-10046 SS5]|nr:hypothetical protein AURDEDRAFT_98801 [Auricularia subglabra TFB-10046 SS5]